MTSHVSITFCVFFLMNRQVRSFLPHRFFEGICNTRWWWTSVDIVCVTLWVPHPIASIIVGTVWARDKFLLLPPYLPLVFRLSSSSSSAFHLGRQICSPDLLTYWTVFRRSSSCPQSLVWRLSWCQKAKPLVGTVHGVGTFEECDPDSVLLHHTDMLLCPPGPSSSCVSPVWSWESARSYN